MPQHAKESVQNVHQVHKKIIQTKSDIKRNPEDI